MKYQELILLLPCHSLEDFPTYHEGDDANSLLASWSALWHPQLLAAAGQAPKWQRVDEPPTDVKGRLIVVPSVCLQRLPTGFAQRVKDEGGVLIRKTTTRDEILSAALADPPSPSLEPRAPSPPIDPDLVADFLALGYCYLQIELLTRQMRYSSNLDETYFKGTAVAAAVAAVEGNAELAREKLSACFSVLAEERDHYYPVDAYVLDLNLTAASTLGEGLRNELSRQSSTNLLISADLLGEMATKEPNTLSALKDGLAAGRIGLIGGEASEDRLPLLSHESILAELQRGLQKYEDLLGRRPHIFGRWRYGLTPHLPGILHKLGFKGALHTGFEEGKTPDGLQFKVRWEGVDGSAIDAIAKTPLDASKPQTFLGLATKLGESMDSDHVATLCLAHWPGQASPWIDDLRRIARYCSALGKWVTVDEYFQNTDHPGQLDRFEADRYRSPYLKQAVIRKHDDPISTPVRYSQQQSETTSALAMESLAKMITSTPVLSTQYSSPAEHLAATLAKSNPTAPRGTLLLNPASVVRRIGVENLGLSGLPVIERPVYSADQHQGVQHAVVDVPAFGFVHLTPGKPAPRDTKALLLAEDGVLRNEFFEAIINPTTGSLAAIHEYKSRGNRLSQQLALRMPSAKQKPGDTHRDPDESAVYSVMAADSLETTIATTALGEIVARGRLLDADGKKVAAFVQTYRLWRGSRVLHVEVELEPVEEPRADPWNSYYCCRFAWSDELAEIFRTVNETRQPAGEKRFEAPHYFELSSDNSCTTILTGGLAFHRRHEDRMLDTLLIARGERQRKFRFGIGVDLAHPLHEALGILTQPIIVRDVPQPSSGASGWLLHLSSRNVIATSLSPFEEGGRIVGFRARLLETAGRPANLAISTFRPIRSAATVDFQGKTLTELSIDDGKAKLDLAAHEWTQIDARFKTCRPLDLAAAKLQTGMGKHYASHFMIVAIDGPAGAGKSSIARRLAERLGFAFLDTGAMYRAVTLAALRAGLGPDDTEAIAQLAKELTIDFDGVHTLLNGEDVSAAIRTSEVSATVHLAADNVAVRKRFVELQRQIANGRDIVTEGRDQGTVAFPAAECKIFLTAGRKERARRRYEELAARGDPISFDEVLAQQDERDRRDAARPVGALVKAADAVEVPTDGLTLDEVVEQLLRLVLQTSNSESSPWTSRP